MFKPKVKANVEEEFDGEEEVAETEETPEEKEEPKQESKQVTKEELLDVVKGNLNRALELLNYI